MSVSGGSKLDSKIGAKPQSKFGNAGKMLVGQHKKQFDDIPDSVSHYSKAKTTNKIALEKRRAVEKEDKLTAKPNEYIMDRHNNTATLK